MTEEHSLLYRVWAAFFDEEMRGADTGEEEQVPDCWYPSAGLFIARDRRFCLAVKAGDNDDSHNHNDVGSFTVYRDGVPMFIDVGVESYTRKTFSPQRYEIWTMQSGYHNLPAFGGVDQKDGKEFGASHVRWELGEERAEIEMELAGLTRRVPSPPMCVRCIWKREGTSLSWIPAGEAAGRRCCL